MEAESFCAEQCDRYKGGTGRLYGRCRCFSSRAAVNAETGKRFGRSIDPDTNGYTNETFEEGTVGLDMTLSLFEGFSRIHQVRFRKMNKERSEWALKNKQNELAYQVTDAYYKLILERKLLNLALEQSRLSERYLKQTEAFVEPGIEIRFRFTGSQGPQRRGYLSL